MKKLSILLILFSLLITTGCVTTKKEKTKIVLPPVPEREEMPMIETTKDIAKVINYYEHLVQKWESWGDSVILLVGGEE